MLWASLHLSSSSTALFVKLVFINCYPQQEEQTFGRAASEEDLAAQPAAHHRGRTRVLTNYYQSLLFLSPPLFWDRTSLFFTSIKVRKKETSDRRPITKKRENWYSMSDFKLDVSFEETPDVGSDAYKKKTSNLTKSWKRGGGDDVQFDTSDFRFYQSDILVRFRTGYLRRLISSKKRGKCGLLRPAICGDSRPTPILCCGSGAKAPQLAARAKYKRHPDLRH